MKLFNYQLNLDLTVFKKTFLQFMALGSIYLLPFVVNNLFFLDDYFFISDSLRGMKESGRPLADFVVGNFNSPALFSYTDQIVDTGFLSILVALFFLSLTGAALSVYVFKEEQSFFHSLVLFPVIMNPFFLEVFSYKFASLVGALCFFIAVLALLVSDKKIQNLVIASVLLFISMLLYQISINVFISGVAFLFFVKALQSQKEALDFLYVKMNTALLASLFHFLFILSYGSRCGYFKEHSETVPFNSTGLKVLIDNFIQSKNILFYSFENYGYLKIFVIATLVYSVIQLCVNESKEKVFKVFAFFISLMVLLFSFSGLTIFLVHPIFNARIFMSFAFLMIFVLYCYQRFVVSKFNYAKILLILIAMVFIHFSYVYASVVKSQTEFNSSNAKRIIEKLEDFNIKTDDIVVLDGNFAWAKTVTKARVNNLIKIILFDGMQFKNNWYSGIFLRYQGLKTDKVLAEAPEAKRKMLCRGNPIHENSSFKIYKLEQVFLVSFNEGVCY